jgi:hypothetical protein
MGAMTMSLTLDVGAEGRSLWRHRTWRRRRGTCGCDNSTSSGKADITYPLDPGSKLNEICRVSIGGVGRIKERNLGGGFMDAYDRERRDKRRYTREICTTSFTYQWH